MNTQSIPRSLVFRDATISNTQPAGSTSSSATSGTSNSSSASQSSKSDKADSGAFKSFLEDNLTPAADGTVDEESLYCAIVKERMKELKGDDGLAKFNSTLEKTQKEYKSVEEATKYALMLLQQGNYITYEQGNTLNAQAFDAAQLDSNKDALYDGIGSATDLTKATKVLKDAIDSATTTMQTFDNGTATPLGRPVAVWNTGIENVNRIGAKIATITNTKSSSVSTQNVTSDSIKPNGTKMDGTGGFLFKPSADSDNKLAVLSPDNVGPMVSSILLKDSAGNIIERGRFTSFGDDGKNRAKYSFNKPGSSYEKNLTVQISYVNGAVQDYNIPDPSKRYD